MSFDSRGLHKAIFERSTTATIEWNQTQMFEHDGDYLNHTSRAHRFKKFA